MVTPGDRAVDGRLWGHFTLASGGDRLRRFSGGVSSPGAARVAVGQARGGDEVEVAGEGAESEVAVGDGFACAGGQLDHFGGAEASCDSRRHAEDGDAAAV